jgi:hypothetical protein
LKALDVESSKVIDLEKFVPRGDLDPVYLDTPYYLYPDDPVAEETLGVIGAAMAEAGVVGLGRLMLSRRERMVAVEPRGTGTHTDDGRNIRMGVYPPKFLVCGVRRRVRLSVQDHRTRSAANPKNQRPSTE